eukprot:752610-Hanusia_phi.AAC.2
MLQLTCDISSCTGPEKVYNFLTFFELQPQIMYSRRVVAHRCLLFLFAWFQVDLTSSLPQPFIARVSDQLPDLRVPHPYGLTSS